MPNTFYQQCISLWEVHLSVNGIEWISGVGCACQQKNCPDRALYAVPMAELCCSVHVAPWGWRSIFHLCFSVLSSVPHGPVIEYHSFVTVIYVCLCHIVSQVTRFDSENAHRRTVCDARIKQFIVPYMPIFLAALLIGASPNLYARGIFAEWQTLSRFFGPSSTKDQRRR